MISILIPTRKRPERLRATLDSIFATSINPLYDKRNSPEILCYISDDDNSYDQFSWREMHGSAVRGPLLCFSDLLECADSFSDERLIFMLCADDVIFQNRGFRHRYRECIRLLLPVNKIMLAYADDGGPNGKRFASLPFVSAPM